MLHVHTTLVCNRVPGVLLALEETGASYDVRTYPPGSFLERYGVPGPWLEGGGARLFELNAILRFVARVAGGDLAGASPVAMAEVDQWMDYFLTNVRPAILRWQESLRAAGAPPAPGPPPMSDEVLSAIARPARVLQEREYIAGAFSVADCTYSTALSIGAHPQVASAHPSFSAYSARLGGRAALARGRERLAAAPAADSAPPAP